MKDYAQLVPELVETLKQTAKSLQGTTIINLNATAVGGGVAELLKSEVALQRDLGLNAHWYVIPPNDDFFEVTKKMHNLLQGKPGELTSQDREIYLQHSKTIAHALSAVTTEQDILMIHDPQPIATLNFINKHRPKIALWRCHIDSSLYSKSIWDFLVTYLQNYDGYIFTSPEYVHKEMLNSQRNTFITPGIDPLSLKNLLSNTVSENYIQKFGIDTNKPLITQVARLDPWKDPIGVIDAYRLAKKEIPDLQLALVAQSATDDPEGQRLYLQVKQYINNEPGIFLLFNLEDNDHAVNAFQRYSDIILQKSIREGFGLTVTEAMWKKAVVIGGNVGGIKIQIQDGINGFLVNSISETANCIIHLLKNPQLKQQIANNAHETVQSKYLILNTILKNLILYKSLLKR